MNPSENSKDWSCFTAAKFSEVYWHHCTWPGHLLLDTRCLMCENLKCLQFIGCLISAAAHWCHGESLIVSNLEATGAINENWNCQYLKRQKNSRRYSDWWLPIAKSAIRSKNFQGDGERIFSREPTWKCERCHWIIWASHIQSRDKFDITYTLGMYSEGQLFSRLATSRHGAARHWRRIWRRPSIKP